MKEIKIEISNDTRLELIMRVLMTNKIVEAKSKNISELDLDVEELVNRTNEINSLIFNEEFIKEIGELVGEE